jgi:hypothetical protein
MGIGIRLTLLIATILVVAGSASGAGGAKGAAELTFYPQAGILWQDLYPANFVDLDPGPGARDYTCGTQTYDGHTGIDTNVRSFREMDIGVPVFAALDGRVLSVQDGEYDRNFGPRAAKFDNHAVLEHGPGRFTIYGHLRKGIKLKRGQKVVAGQQLGWTASSGNSSWPHLHFTSQVASEIDEPFAGECRAGASGWADQVEMPSQAYVRDFALSTKPFVRKADVPYDHAKRTGAFATGTRMVYARVELGLFKPGASIRIRFLRPDGSAAVDQTPDVGFRFPNGLGRASVGYRISLKPVGAWRLLVDVRGARSADAVAGRRRPVPCADLARDGGSRLRHRPLSVSLDRRRTDRPGDHQRSTVGCSSQGRRGLRTRAFVRRSTKRRPPVWAARRCVGDSPVVDRVLRVETTARERASSWTTCCR